MKKTKRFISLALALILMLALVPLNVSAEVISKNWKTISWSIDTQTGLFTLYGNYEDSPTGINNDVIPWRTYKNSITEVLAKEGITSLGSSYFSRCESLEKVSLPDSLRKIHNNVFYGCTSLKEINFPENLTLIDTYAFRECSNLKSITIPAKVVKIGHNAFKSCPKLSTVIFCGDAPELVRETNRDGPFENNNKLTIYYPNNADGWEDVIRLPYLASINWVSYNPANGLPNVNDTQSVAEENETADAQNPPTSTEQTTTITETSFFPDAGIKLTLNKTHFVPDEEITVTATADNFEYKFMEGFKLVYRKQNDNENILFLKYIYLTNDNINNVRKIDAPSEKGSYELVLLFEDRESEENKFVASVSFTVGDPPVSTTPLTATPTSSTVLVNGKNIAFDAYHINGNNYFKLRDVAYVLSGTEKQFEVSYNEATNAILLHSGKPYTPVGGEMAGKGTGSKTATPTTSKIYLDGQEIKLTAYNIGGNNYFKLRDIGSAFDFGVDWDGAKNTIVIDTSKGYTPPA